MSSTGSLQTVTVAGKITKMENIGDVDTTENIRLTLQTALTIKEIVWRPTS